MGLLDQVLGSMLGGDRTNEVTPGQASGLAQAVMSMLNDVLRSLLAGRAG
jgi:hypothetical protein